MDENYRERKTGLLDGFQANCELFSVIFYMEK